MTVAKFVQPDYPTQTGTAYPSNIDAAVKVLSEMGQDFAPHAADTPDLTVKIDAGKSIKADGTLVEQPQQSIAFTAPTANPRIDRIVLDPLTLVASRVEGTEAASPAVPAIPAGKLPCAQASLSVGQTQITNADITDERTCFAQTPAANLGAGALPAGVTLAPTQLSAGSVPSGVTVPLARLDASAANAGYPQSGTGGETLRTIRGQVNADGTIRYGTGFTVSKLGTGQYEIDWVTRFAAPATVTGTIADLACGEFAVGPSTFAGHVEVRTHTVGTGYVEDKAFTFIAIGPA